MKESVTVVRGTRPLGSANLIERIVDDMSRHWQADRFHDDYEARLRVIIAAKSKGDPIPLRRVRPR